MLSAEWKDVDLEAREWRIPAERMKMRRTHIVPLSNQAVDILRVLEPITGQGRYLFPASSDPDKYLRDNRILFALKKLGYANGEMSFHGFRAMASTLLNELGYNRDWIERQFAHCSHDAVHASCNYAEHLPERRRMILEWSDYLTALNTQEGKNYERTD